MQRSVEFELQPVGLTSVYGAGFGSSRLDHSGSWGHKVRLSNLRLYRLTLAFCVHSRFHRLTEKVLSYASAG